MAEGGKGRERAGGASEIFSSFAECNTASLAKGVLTESQRTVIVLRTAGQERQQKDKSLLPAQRKATV